MTVKTKIQVRMKVQSTKRIQTKKFPLDSLRFFTDLILPQFFPVGQSDRGKECNHSHSVPQLRIRGVISPLPNTHSRRGVYVSLVASL
jgi:hypothetical protein